MPRVGMLSLFDDASAGVDERREALARMAEAGIDHVGVGDHVSFFVGAGRDGLIDATATLSAQASLPVYVGLYLLPLRHPVPSRGSSRRSRSLPRGVSRSAWGSVARIATRSRLRRGPEHARPADGRVPAGLARLARR